MSISNGRDSLERIALEYNGNFFRFGLNPQNLQDSRPYRSTVIKTKQDINVQDFGADVPQISISGVTGVYHGKGYDRMVALKSFIMTYINDGGDGNPRTSYLRFHNFTNGESWTVTLDTNGMEWTQDSSNPLQYTYTITFDVLSSASLPAYTEVSWAELGNTSPSIGGGNYGSYTYIDNYNYNHGLTAINPNTTSGAHKIAVVSLENVIGYTGGSV